MIFSLVWEFDGAVYFFRSRSYIFGLNPAVTYRALEKRERYFTDGFLDKYIVNIASAGDEEYIGTCI